MYVCGVGVCMYRWWCICACAVCMCVGGGGEMCVCGCVCMFCFLGQQLWHMKFPRVKVEL